MLIVMKRAFDNLYFFDWIAIALLILGIAIVILSTILIQNRKYEITSSAVLKECAIDRKRIWLRTGIIWYCINYVLLLFGFVCTIVLIYMAYTLEETGSTYQIRVVIYSGISLFVSIAPHILQPMKKSEGYHNAYILLDAALIEGNETEIRKALVDGEKVIGELHYR